ncbi:uncharacterized protein LOC130713340 [Lotus japonicus]|uniref:uncharacterized protein LOC130713340 n=1 Tax=Lotus japonicus TaxID=34305 RepID=UPI00259085FA|nr:uncharacterized protein LOC130713340 [Lotus japonicus]
MGSVLFRDERGDLTFGATKRFFTTKPILAEALALREAVLTASNMQIGKIIFESDNLQLVEACLRRKTVGVIQNIVEDILTWKRNFPNWGFTWTGRSGNQSAHALARLALHNSLPPSWFWKPPDDLRAALSLDKQRSQVYRVRGRAVQDGRRRA